MADYAATARHGHVHASKHDRHPTELACCAARGLVTASETEEGRAWAEARIKQHDRRRPRSRPGSCGRTSSPSSPPFKLTIIGNHKPRLHNVDDAARRRFNIVPFVHKPAKPDPQLEEKLKAEWPAILRWMIEGCLDWQANGLVGPRVSKPQRKVFRRPGPHKQWMDERCKIDQSNDYLLSEATSCSSHGKTMRQMQVNRWVALKASLKILGIEALRRKWHACRRGRETCLSESSRSKWGRIRTMHSSVCRRVAGCSDYIHMCSHAREDTSVIRA